MSLKETVANIGSKTWALPLGLFVALLMVLISELAYFGAISQMDRLATLNRARVELVRLTARVTDAESGQRGYLITGRPEYLDPYRFAAEDASKGLDALQRMYSQVDAPDAERRSKEIAAAVSAKLSELQEVLKLHQDGRVQAAQTLMMTDIGRDQMELIRRRSAELLADENNRIALGTAQVYDTLMLNRIGVAAMTLISLLVFGLFLRKSRAMDEQRERQQQDMRAERDLLEVEVGRRTAELTQLARHLQTAREDERARLARDLHDELGALLTAAKLDVARLRPKLQAGAPELMQRLTHLTETLNSGIALKRRIIEDLRPSTLDQLGLVAALEILCRESAERLGVPIDLELEEGVQLPRSAQLTAFRLVQEALTNMSKYAQATHAKVMLKREYAQALVSVSDNGCGFDPAQMNLGSHGLLGMRFRVEAERGQLQLQSAPGQGTVIRAWLPLSEDAPPVPADLPTF
ncbi:CHASE3 domain-containing protein [Roseateles amylovorans]|uniref:CHASE3 domain-containing protein n=1 Tax=Roseateles amylovorans TaxID=2978473 RepID=A0ABY6B0N8_9BURK|nr:CHASE3 domain-containing protein [Roseateles amylovorans]UXH78405.1 CHASE3 domain-containing protein [Roseateles amylovorans]